MGERCARFLIRLARSLWAEVMEYWPDAALPAAWGRAILPWQELLPPRQTTGRGAALEALMSGSLWELATARRQHQVFSTLFPSRSVEEQLNTEEGIADAIDWCRKTSVTKVYVESFRDGLLAREQNLARARDRFRTAGLEVSGCVTTTRMAKSSEVGWDQFPCFTHAATQEQLQKIFEFTAQLFDEIMIDDFYCTACECSECRAARGTASWAGYRLDLMYRVSRERVLGAARAVNPGVRIIIKYPQWYEEFHERGYDVDRQTELFDRIWVGTEARDMEDARWGGCATYRPFWIMRWLGQIGREKCGGGWYDPYGTHADTYLEQARQTILGGARESLLFCYPSLLRDTGPANIDALRRELPALFDLAAWAGNEEPRGVVSYRPMNSPPDDERYLFDWLGMIGLPIVPTHTFPADTSVAFFSFHALHDPDFAPNTDGFLSRGGRAILTQSAASAANQATRGGDVHVFRPPKEARQIMGLPAARLSALREAALAPLGMGLEGPVGVALYLLGGRKVALENFNSESVEMSLRLQDAGSYRIVLSLGPGRADSHSQADRLAISLPPRSLAALERPE